MRPSWFLSSHFSKPVSSHFLNQVGRSAYTRLPSTEPTGPVWMVLVRFSRAIEPTAGAVRYSRAMNTSAQPAEVRASRTRGTVKKRMMTCGRPAVPIISDRV